MDDPMTHPKPSPVDGLIEELFSEIKHGDNEHQAWLFDALRRSPTLAALQARIEVLEGVVLQAESDLHLIALESKITFEIQRSVVSVKDNLRAALKGDDHV